MVEGIHLKGGTGHTGHVIGQEIGLEVEGQGHLETQGHLDAQGQTDILGSQGQEVLPHPHLAQAPSLQDVQGQSQNQGNSFFYNTALAILFEGRKLRSLFIWQRFVLRSYLI